jgi:acyl carrier protein
MDDTTKSRIYKILKKVTGKEANHLDLNQDLKSQLTIDSIQIVELFAALEAEFSLELPLSMMTVKSGSAFLKVLEEQLEKTIN